MITTLFEHQVTAALEDLEGWDKGEDGKSIYKSFKFKDFEVAWAFMSRVAEQADHMNHHPDWSNVYNSVDITLSTHDAGGITEKDITLANAIAKIEAAIRKEYAVDNQRGDYE